MTSTRRQFIQTSWAATFAISAGGLLAACGDDDGESSSDEGSTTSTTAAALRELKAMMPFPLFLGFIADVTAASGGFMRDQGVDLKLEFARSSPQALQQLAAGNVTVIRNAPLAVVRAVSQEDAPFVSIAMANQEILYVLVSTEDAPVEAVSDLTGKTVGLPTLGSNAQDTFELVMKLEGVDPASVQLVAVGNEAAALSFVEDGRVDALFATRESTAGMKAAGLDPHVVELETNPLLGTNLVTTRDNLTGERDVLVDYLRGLHTAMLAINDEEQLEELIPKVRADWDLPQLDDPDKAKQVIAAVASMWFAAGEENLLRHVPELWEEGVEGFARLRIAAPDSQATDFYTNDLIEEALD